MADRADGRSRRPGVGPQRRRRQDDAGEPVRAARAGRSRLRPAACVKALLARVSRVHRGRVKQSGQAQVVRQLAALDERVDVAAAPRVEEDVALPDARLLGQQPGRRAAPRRRASASARSLPAKPRARWREVGVVAAPLAHAVQALEDPPGDAPGRVGVVVGAHDGPRRAASASSWARTASSCSAQRGSAAGRPPRRGDARGARRAGALAPIGCAQSRRRSPGRAPGTATRAGAQAVDRRARARRRPAPPARRPPRRGPGATSAPACSPAATAVPPGRLDERADRRGRQQPGALGDRVRVGPQRGVDGRRRPEAALRRRGEGNRDGGAVARAGQRQLGGAAAQLLVQQEAEAGAVLAPGVHAPGLLDAEARSSTPARLGIPLQRSVRTHGYRATSPSWKLPPHSPTPASASSATAADRRPRRRRRVRRAPGRRARRGGRGPGGRRRGRDRDRRPRPRPRADRRAGGLRQGGVRAGGAVGGGELQPTRRSAVAERPDAEGREPSSGPSSGHAHQGARAPLLRRELAPRCSTGCAPCSTEVMAQVARGPRAPVLRRRTAATRWPAFQRAALRSIKPASDQQHAHLRAMNGTTRRAARGAREPAGREGEARGGRRRGRARARPRAAPTRRRSPTRSTRSRCRRATTAPGRRRPARVDGQEGRRRRRRSAPATARRSGRDRLRGQGPAAQPARRAAGARRGDGRARRRLRGARRPDGGRGAGEDAPAARVQRRQAHRDLRPRATARSACRSPTRWPGPAC